MAAVTDRPIASLDLWRDYHHHRHHLVHDPYLDLASLNLAVGLVPYLYHDPYSDYVFPDGHHGRHHGHENHTDVHRLLDTGVQVCHGQIHSLAVEEGEMVVNMADVEYQGVRKGGRVEGDYQSSRAVEVLEALEASEGEVVLQTAVVVVRCSRELAT